ncbi:hypothetical protein MKQ68_11960 [Chitinophaga horti]|uniref:MG2 domain-containing protein n=1 Tax=Chitinophaga horti TaxID=2920382 RepID=A0ABY6JBZ7_9BACT|nr:hypothetical protein [Chitinophaga horti]UYQ95816.1 hypothetical protein MKQ68_11960 [Chitinophaga horti]
MRLTAYLFLLFTTLPTICFSQQADEQLEQIIHRFGEKSRVRALPAVYLHLDKTVYVRNEHIWFTAYLINGAPETAHTLYVSLTDPMKKRTVLREQFVLSNFLAQGYLMLPDSLETGEYRLTAYTNSYLQDQRQEVFQQAISVRAPDKSRLQVADMSQPGDYGQPLKVKYKVTNYEQKPADKEDFVYALYMNNRMLDSGRKKTDIWGEVPLQLKAPPDTVSELVLDVKAYYKNESKSTRLPVAMNEPLRMRWFPEGGQLVEGRRMRVAFEITEKGRALAVSGTLFADGLPVTTFTSNTAGRGWMYFVPFAGKKYTVQLNDRKTAVTAALPEIKPDGYTLFVTTGLPGDTLTAEITAPKDENDCYVVLHNYHEAFFSGAVNLPQGAARIKIPLHDMPRGMANLTLFDKQGEPVAERAVMLQNAKRLNVSITTDSAEYHTRSKVKTTIKVTNNKGEPVKAVLSVGMALDKRIDTLRFRNIDRYYYFEQHLPAATLLPAHRFFENEQQLEELLLTKCWTRYQPKAEPLPAPQVYDENLHGQVLLRQKPLRRPATMLLLSTESSSLLTTDSAGRFRISYEQLRGPADTKFSITALGGERRTELQDYSVVLDKNPLDTLNRQLTEVYIPYQPLKEDILSAEEKIKMKSMLKEVVVKARNEDYYNEFRSKTCNDWVCMYNVLNCRNHPYGTKPESGMQYKYGSGMVTYRACAQDSAAATAFMKKIHGTWYTKEFYLADYSTFNPPDPEMHTTIYWNHSAMTDNNGELHLSFYTNDLTGRFAFIAEGFSDEGVMSGRGWIRVVDK